MDKWQGMEHSRGQIPETTEISGKGESRRKSI